MKSNGKKATPSSNATALMLSRMCLYGARVGCTMPLILLINFLLLITYSQRDRNFIAYTWSFPIGWLKKDCSHSTEMELQRTICTILTFSSWTMKKLQSPRSVNLSIMNKFLKVRHFVENFYAIQIMQLETNKFTWNVSSLGTSHSWTCIYTSMYYTVHTDFQLIPFSHLISETVSADLVVLIGEKSYFWTEYHIIQLLRRN